MGEVCRGHTCGGEKGQWIGQRAPGSQPHAELLNEGVRATGWVGGLPARPQAPTSHHRLFLPEGTPEELSRPSSAKAFV